MTRRTILLLNFTAPVYHWGCYGTATEIYLSLVERGYLVNWLDVRTTHEIGPTPACAEDFNSGAFLKAFLGSNKVIYHALGDADLVVVNGEGTLHRTHRAPLNLLYLMHLAQNALRKPVHLINHSLFPGGGLEPHPENDALYAQVVTRLTRVVPRENASAEILRRLGARPQQGFDCLPRFIARSGITGSPPPVDAPVVLSGGVNQTAGTAQRIARAVGRSLPSGIAVHFLSGAKSRPAAEDRECFDAMRTVLPQLEWVEAGSMEAWVQAIRQARCLVSGRFHHTLAAVTLGTPAIVLPSNTPKTDATCALLGLPAPLAPDRPDLEAQIHSGLVAAFAGHAPVITAETRARMLALAAENFVGL